VIKVPEAVGLSVLQTAEAMEKLVDALDPEGFESGRHAV
jgi:hypothetical protein